MISAENLSCLTTEQAVNKINNLRKEKNTYLIYLHQFDNDYYV